jgi:putative exporter of polyketide antibiotics
MSANIYTHEFRTRLKSVVIWSLAMAAMILFFFSIFPGFAEQAALMKDLLAKFPRELLAAFSMDNMDLSSVLDFYSLVFLFVQLCLAIQAGNYGFGLVSIEESELTADFLLSKPVSRTQVLTSKLLAALTSLTITNLVVWFRSHLAFPRRARVPTAHAAPVTAQHRDLPTLLPERWAGRFASGQARAQRNAVCPRPGLRFVCAKRVQRRVW